MSIAFERTHIELDRNCSRTLKLVLEVMIRYWTDMNTIQAANFSRKTFTSASFLALLVRILRSITNDEV